MGLTTDSLFSLLRYLAERKRFRLEVVKHRFQLKPEKGKAFEESFPLWKEQQSFGVLPSQIII